MDANTIFYAQIASVVVFLLALFGLYRLLVSAKDATIDMLKEKVGFLETQLSQARTEAPDVLAKSLTERVTQLSAELERVMADKTATSKRVIDVEEQLAKAQHDLNDYRHRIERIREFVDNFRQRLDVDRQYAVRAAEAAREQLVQEIGLLKPKLEQGDSND